MSIGEILRTADLATRLKMTSAAIRAHLQRKTGAIPPARKVGGRWVWYSAEVDEWLRSQPVTSNEE